MRIFTSWISDPCVHVLAIGLVLAYLAMGAGSDPDPEPKDEVRTFCQTCTLTHGEREVCPLPAVRLAAH